MKLFKSFCLVTLLTCLSLGTSTNLAEAGILRTRERFNINADGFWMKGKCFIPGAVEIPDEYNLVIFSRFDEFGCLVKNRKGERRPGKRKSDNWIRLSWIIRDDSGRTDYIHMGEKECNHVRRCRTSVERRLPTGTPLPPPFRIVGLVANICGRRSEGTATHFEVHVGDTPEGEGVRNVRRELSSCP